MNAIVKADSRVAINIGKKIKKALTKDLIAQQLLKLIESSHVRGERTLALIQQGYYWPQIGDNVQEYVKTCLICQQNKVERRMKAWLLQPLLVPMRLWESVSIDFITGLLKVKDLGTILVVVDRFSKYASFIAALKYCSAEETTQFFFKYLVKYWDTADPSKGEIKRPGLKPKEAGKRVAESILNDRVITASGKHHQEYLVKW
ncbi:hypothetical protein RJ639_008622 [Escallonia herrerae]|uniref:Integrase zinc-binding domain-containing protein n=1 Tax=Escallonia herrerae TaxID=1293975 RepID=A0AA88VZE1_9ASTE|nr:hypothetical protein RJ639_008622 [Escallonia herrerae]